LRVFIDKPSIQFFDVTREGRGEGASSCHFATQLSSLLFSQHLKSLIFVVHIVYTVRNTRNFSDLYNVQYFLGSAF